MPKQVGGMGRAQPSGNAEGKAAAIGDRAPPCAAGGASRNIVGPSNDILRRVLSLLLGLLELEGAGQCSQVCQSWKQEVEAWGFCNKTLKLCLVLAEGGDAVRLGQIVMQRLNESSGKTMQDHLLDARGFLLRRSHVGSFFENHVHKGWEGSPHEYLQAASQEPDASFLSRGAASTAQCYGLKLVRWVGKPQGRANSFSAYWNQVSGHSGGDPCIAFSPDGTRVVSGSGDQLVKIWNSETGAEVWSTARHNGMGLCICTVDSDGKRVVNPDCLDLGAGKVTSIAFSSDGKRVVSGSREGLVKIWNAANGAEVCTLAGHSDEVCSVAFSSDGTRVFTSTDEGCVKIWDAERGAEVCTLPGQHEGGVWSAAVSSDGKRVVIGTDDLVKIFNAETGAEVCSLEGHQGPVRAVAFSSDAKRIASGELHGSVKIWNAETGEKMIGMSEHNGEGICLCTVDAAGHPELDDFFDEPIIDAECPVIGDTKSVERVRFSDDGSLVFSAGEDTTLPVEVRVWDVASGKLVCELEGGLFALVEGASGEHGGVRHVLTVDDDMLRIYQVPQELQPAEGGAAPLEPLALESMASFRAPQDIVSVRCHGAAICVACGSGAVCFLSAPFLAV